MGPDSLISLCNHMHWKRIAGLDAQKGFVFPLAAVPPTSFWVPLANTAPVATTVNANAIINNLFMTVPPR
jgi:hypothetical protein